MGDPPNSLVALGSALYWQLPGDDKAGTWTMSQSGGAATKLAATVLLPAQKQGITASLTTTQGLVFSATNVLSTDPSNSHLWRSSWSLLFPHWTTTALIDFNDSDALGLYYPDSITRDATNLYFVSDRHVGLPNEVYQMPLGGGAPFKIGVADNGSPLAVYAGNVYFVVGSSIVTAPVGGGNSTTFVTDNGQPTTFAVDGSTLYWTCTSCGTVSKRAFGGGAVTTIASNEKSPEFLAVGSSDVYWGVSLAVRHRSK